MLTRFTEHYDAVADFDGEYEKPTDYCIDMNVFDDLIRRNSLKTTMEPPLSRENVWLNTRMIMIDNGIGMKPIRRET